MEVYQGTSSIIYKFNECELTQHDAELKAKWCDEIESLKNKLADLTEEYELTVEAFDREYAKQNVQLRKAFNERNSERLKVITELEEWVDKQPKATYWLNDNESEEHLAIKNINQKLNEMKGEMKGDKK